MQVYGEKHYGPRVKSRQISLEKSIAKAYKLAGSCSPLG